MNKELLRKVKRAILREPRQFSMAWFFAKSVTDPRTHEPITPPNCGTAACIAGWAVALSEGKRPGDYDPDKGGVGRRAQAALGIDLYQSDDLFYTSNWPEKYASKYHKARSFAERARVAARRIDYFIETGQ